MTDCLDENHVSYIHFGGSESDRRPPNRMPCCDWSADGSDRQLRRRLGQSRHLCTVEKINVGGKWAHTKPGMWRNVTTDVMRTEDVANKQVRGTDVAYGEMCARLALGGVEGSNTIERDVIK